MDRANLMIETRIPSILFISSAMLALVLVFSSCVSTKGGSLQQDLDQQEQYIASGEPQKAIDGYNTTLKKYPDEAVVVQSYIQTLERMKTSADKAYKAQRYTSAIQTYTVLSKNFHHFKSFEKSLSFDAKYINRRLRESRIGRSKILARNGLKSGDYMKAIEAFSASLQYYPKDKDLKNSFGATVTEIHSIGEKALKSSHHITAGKAYSALLRKYSLIEKSAANLPFSKKTAESGLKQCQNILMRKGLEQYRKGNLDAAIAIWKDILKFDPDDVEVKKAIQNAESQLKKIKKESKVQRQLND
jgi:tetratricopeptide (TPR) repeat protein